jgi:hypothetical protein
METVEAKEQKVPIPTVIDISKEGPRFDNQQELANAARLMIKVKMAPTHLVREGVEAVMSALLFIKQFHLPLTAMNEIGFVKGRVTVYGSLFTALAERHEQYGDHEHFFVTKEGDRISSDNKNLGSIPWAHVTKIRKKGSDIWNEYYFSIEDAEQAGLLTKNTSQDSAWLKYTKDLLFHKSKNRALKANYASALNGALYHEDFVEEKFIEREVSQSDGAKSLNDLFADKPEV